MEQRSDDPLWGKQRRRRHRPFSSRLSLVGIPLLVLAVLAIAILGGL